MAYNEEQDTVKCSDEWICVTLVLSRREKMHFWISV